MTTSRKDEIERNLEAVKEKIAVAEKEAGRSPGEVKLLPVTKFHPSSDIEILKELGITAVGENREQEGRQKAEEIPGIDFHMIGQVQTKKANAVARWAKACHSVDSIRLADGLNRGVQLSIERGQRDGQKDAVLGCFIQISADGDTSRGGILAEDVPGLAEHILSLDNLALKGLMVVPPLEANPREVFDNARALADSLATKYAQVMELSAGMNIDLEQAIAAGTNIVRVGTEILGNRQLA